MTNASKVERVQEWLRSLAAEEPVCEACVEDRVSARQKWIDEARAMMDAEAVR